VVLDGDQVVDDVRGRTAGVARHLHALRSVTSKWSLGDIPGIARDSRPELLSIMAKQVL
jgi:hypothetical protein